MKPKKLPPANEPDDQLPPYDGEAEAGALACVVASADLDQPEAERMLDQLNREDFFDLRNQNVYAALRYLRLEGPSLTVLSLYQYLT